MLVATFQLGNVKESNAVGINKTHSRQLQKEGYDSLCIHAFGGDEYVIYNYDEASNIHRFKPDLSAAAASSRASF